MRNRSKAFTLIELLVVIAIIGILAAIILVNVENGKSKALDAKRIADIRDIQSALELYANDHAYLYPTALSLLTPTYMSQIPSDPGTGDAYSYTAFVPTLVDCQSGGGPYATAYHLGASLQNTSNVALLSDADSPKSNATDCSSDFSGLSTAAGGQPCSSTAGTAQPNGTETCYDVHS